MQKVLAAVFDLLTAERQAAPVEAIAKTERNWVGFLEDWPEVPVTRPRKCRRDEYVHEAVHGGDRGGRLVGERVLAANSMVQAGCRFERQLPLGTGTDEFGDSVDGRDGIGRDTPGAKFCETTNVLQSVEFTQRDLAIGIYRIAHDLFGLDCGSAFAMGIGKHRIVQVRRRTAELYPRNDESPEHPPVLASAIAAIIRNRHIATEGCGREHSRVVDCMFK